MLHIKSLYVCESEQYECQCRGSRNPNYTWHVQVKAFPPSSWFFRNGFGSIAIYADGHELEMVLEALAPHQELWDSAKASDNGRIMEWRSDECDAYEVLRIIHSYVQNNKIN